MGMHSGVNCHCIEEVTAYMVLHGHTCRRHLQEHSRSMCMLFANVTAAMLAGNMSSDFSMHAYIGPGIIDL